jgi:starch synthase
LGDKWVSGEIWYREPQKNLIIYFVKVPEFYDRPGIYNEADGDYPDNAERYIFFSKAVVHLARYLPWKPEVVHAHDWQTGMVPLMIKHQALNDGWEQAPASVFTIHNQAYQGLFKKEAYVFANLPAGHFHPEGAEQYGNLNCFKAGVEYADAITTVSPRYAREIMTEEYGCGLDAILRRRKNRLYGILNGVDYDEWNTQRNVCLARSTSSMWETSTMRSALSTRRGISFRSLRFSRGISTVVMRFRCAARSFSFKPPMGITRPRSVISPVMATSFRTGSLVRALAMLVAMVTPALGPSLRTKSGKCTCTSIFE